MPNFGTERNQRAWEKLTPEQKAKAEEIIARHRSPSYRAAEQQIREDARREFPPLAPDPELVGVLTALRRERKRQGLSLTDMHQRTGIDRSTISKLELGRVSNPTYATLTALARALGTHLTLGLSKAPLETKATSS
jgi:ribosome-binding protein aMBF1 (putative translation factor)